MLPRVCFCPQIGHLKSYYGFRHRETAKRSAESNGDVTVGIAKETEVTERDARRAGGPR